MKQKCRHGLDQASLYKGDSVSAYVSHTICRVTLPTVSLRSEPAIREDHLQTSIATKRNSFFF
jgi:hypothetical protein